MLYHGVFTAFLGRELEWHLALGDAYLSHRDDLELRLYFVYQPDRAGGLTVSGESMDYVQSLITCSGLIVYK
jgi:hypothetical protein